MLPEADDVGRLRVEGWLTTTALKIDGLEPDALRRLAALVRVTRDGARAIAARLRLSNDERDRLVILVAPPVALGPELDARARRRAFHELGAELARDLALLARSEERV